MDLVSDRPTQNSISILTEYQSLAIALYFASRGSGKVKSQMDGTIEPYTSTARVLLNGFGSDELLGGYARHRTTFNRGGWHAIIDEVGKLYLSDSLCLKFLSVAPSGNR